MNLWLHVASLILYAIATLVVLVYAIPRARAAASEDERLQRAAAAMRIYDPLSIALLGIVVMSGAFGLTALKDALRERFFQVMGPVLMWKLALTFVLIILATYLAFGLGNRLVGYADTDERPAPGWSTRALRRIQITSALILVLCGTITWIAGAMR